VSAPEHRAGATRRRPFRAQLVAAFVGLVLALEALTLFVLDRALGDALVAQLDARLATQAQGAASWIAQRRVDHRTDDAGGRVLDRHAERLDRVVDAHVTIVDEAGRVLGDSSHDDDEDAGGGGSPTLDAPELEAARRDGLARATRLADGGPTYFVAARASNGMVVRLGVPLSAIAAARTTLRARLGVAAALSSLVALALGLVAARLVARPLARVTHAAERLARGEYDVRVDDATPDELGVLGRTLDTLAAELRARIGELVDERDRLRAILEGMREGVLVVDHAGLVALANPSAARLLAPVTGDATPLEGRAIDALLGDGPGPRDAAQLERTFGARHVVVTRHPLERGGERGQVLVLHDVTERHALELMRRDFVAQVSHELRTPVAAIQGYAETLQSTRVDDATREAFLGVIHRHALRIGRLVAQLLRLAELEARPPARPSEVVSIAGALRHVEATLRARAAEADVTVAYDAPADLDAYADADALEQIVENLVDNAIRYGARPGRVTVRARAEGAHVALRVADDGPGIPPEHHARIFDRFYRVDAARSRQLGGTGLGLAIVARLVRGMDGEITVEDAGPGAAFVVRLHRAAGG
jgi:two-component system phosphate regulon sensor histidine kinase PhoR